MGDLGGEEVTMDDLVKTDGLFYKKFTDVPFTGMVTGQEQGSFKKGKREGTWVLYYDNGRIRDKGDYKNGQKDGPWVDYHKNGQLNAKGDYWNGKKDGSWVFYNEDGTVDEELTGTYKNGVKVE